jgi:hypothetical protein
MLNSRCEECGQLKGSKRQYFSPTGIDKAVLTVRRLDLIAFLEPLPDLFYQLLRFSFLSLISRYSLQFP